MTKVLTELPLDNRHVKSDRIYGEAFQDKSEVARSAYARLRKEASFGDTVI